MKRFLLALALVALTSVGARACGFSAQSYVGVGVCAPQVNLVPAYQPCPVQLQQVYQPAYLPPLQLPAYQPCPVQLPTYQAPEPVQLPAYQAPEPVQLPQSYTPCPTQTQSFQLQQGYGGSVMYAQSGYVGTNLLVVRSHNYGYGGVQFVGTDNVSRHFVRGVNKANRREARRQRRKLRRG